RPLLKAADAVVVNGSSGARYVHAMGAAKDKIFVANQTTDLANYLALPSTRANPARRRFLFSGRLIEFKGLLPFLNRLAAHARAHASQQIEFWIMGEGPLRGSLASFPAPDNLQLRFLGHVGYDRLPEIYEQCGILAFPTLADEWGLVVVEAMAS